LQNEMEQGEILRNFHDVGLPSGHSAIQEFHSGF
jgi:hypothetical protein